MHSTSLTVPSYHGQIEQQKKKQVAKPEAWLSLPVITLHFFYDIIGASVSKSNDVHKILKIVLTKYFAHLNEQLKSCLPQVAAEMYSHQLITKSVRDSPTVRSVIDEFENAMKLMKGDVSKLQEHCQLFLQCLSSEGGPAKLAAQKLCQDWMDEVKKQCGISLDLTCDEQGIKQQGLGQYYKMYS